MKKINLLSTSFFLIISVLSGTVLAEETTVQAKYEMFSLENHEMISFKISASDKFSYYFNISPSDEFADVDCYLFDNNGNLIDQDDALASSCEIELHPVSDGRYTLYVFNQSVDTSELTLEFLKKVE